MRWIKGAFGWVMLAVVAVVALGVVAAIGGAILFPNTGESEDEWLERVADECSDRFGAIAYPELGNDPEVDRAIKRCIDHRVTNEATATGP